MPGNFVPLPTIELGYTGLRVSRLAFGTGTHGVGGRSDQSALGVNGLADLLRAGFEAGINGNYVGGMDVMFPRRWTISDNVFIGIHGKSWGARGAIFLWNDTTDCLVENNIMVDNGFHPHVWYEQSGDVFRRNIVFTPHQLEYLVKLYGPEKIGIVTFDNAFHGRTLGWISSLSA